VGVSQALLHHGEEPPLSGSPPGGSGTIFFTRCNLSCVFCQNHAISQTPGAGEDVTAEDLAAVMLELQKMGAYNINLVSPTPYAAQIALAVFKAKNDGLSIPVVYNTGGYDSPEALDLMEGLIDVYLPDVKLGYQEPLRPGGADRRSEKLFGVPDYPAVNRRAVERMLKQTGHLRVGPDGLAVRGLILRHLVLPDNLARTDGVLKWIREDLGKETCLSLMAQYHPANKVETGYSPEFSAYPGLSRPLSVREYDMWVEKAWALGLENTFVQDLEAAGTYLPDFSKPGVFS
jgi:putative pyruvate formate lyase activating enzyme